jgi:guanylate kinase
MDNHLSIVQDFLNSSETKKYNPHSYLIESSERTNIPNIYKNPHCPTHLTPDKKLIIDIFGPSGVGKDTITRLPNIADIRIATSRSRRSGEDETAYVWMNTDQQDEPDFKKLIEQYGLVSHAVENGILYGVPKTGLDEVKNAHVTTIRMSARSLDMLRENLSDEYNIVSLMVVPGNIGSLIPSILERGNVETRLNEIIENMKLGKQYANYFLLNEHITGTNEQILEQIESGKKSFSSLINLLTTQ